MCSSRRKIATLELFNGGTSELKKMSFAPKKGTKELILFSCVHGPVHRAQQAVLVVHFFRGTFLSWLTRSQIDNVRIV
jgi:hypothetical protein